MSLSKIFGFGGGGKAGSPDPDKEDGSVPSFQQSLAAKSKDKGFYFDPEGLERAAKAASVLDKSINASKAFDVIKQQEVTRQLQYQDHIQQREIELKNMELQKISQEWKSKQEFLGKEFEMKKKQLQYEDDMKRRNQADMLNMQRKLKQEELAKQEEAILRQEEIKRKTLAQQAELNKQTELAKAKAEAEGKIKYEQVNHQLHMEKERLKAEENRKTVLESIALATSTVGSGLMQLLNDRERLLAGAGTITLIAIGIYGAKVSSGVAGRLIEARLGKPSLVRETSRKTFKQKLTHPFKLAKDALFPKPSLSASEQALQGVVLPKQLDLRLRNLARAVANTHKNNAPFRHMLFHGPPGTGKTLFSKQIARGSGLDYAIMTGGDIAPLGHEGVTEIHKLFDWAESSRKGVLIFVDEADAFLQKREDSQMTPDMRNALNAFLYRTGEASDKFMLVFSSNQPSQFDSAINDRIDEIIEFGLPGYEERLRMIKQYFGKYIQVKTADGRQIQFPDVDDSTFEEIAKRTDGFSGREISKLAIAWQSTAFGTPDLTITSELMHLTLDNHLSAHAQKVLWNVDENK